ncbi:hypothetical protein ACPF8X_06075 [Streptomyces sp. G35A]
MKKRAGAGAETPFRARDGFNIAGGMVMVVVALAGCLLVMGVWKSFARQSAPLLNDLPGGPWASGGVLGMISVFGAAGALRCRPGTSEGARPVRAARALGTAICWAAAFAPPFYLLGGLPSRNCRASDSRCAYISGTGPAILAFMVSAGVVGWLLHRWFSARDMEYAERERERLRKLRKKGKGKSRAAQKR